MSDVVVLESSLDFHWVVHLHAMANSREHLEAWAAEQIAGREFTAQSDELRMWHIKAAWPARDFVEVHFAPKPNELVRWPLVAWHYGQQRVSEAMAEAGVAFALATGRDPLFALIRQMPARAEEFVEVKGITLLQADWVPTGYLAVGRGGMHLKG
ncbi:MAG: hypothetical protein CVU44_20955 [Chloroflexi bacterium HGW-Chloroflexi-6]|nr:MAG: hypothetical protein CVU44_20955 [Chloroflexi bacterium HGW-Chloroflexi-6]